MRTDFDFRRTVTTLTFCGAGVVLTPLLAWIVQLLQHQPAALTRIAMGVILLLFVVLVGLSMTVALRQVSARFYGADFSARGGEDDAPAPQVTTTTKTEVSP